MSPNRRWLYALTFLVVAAVFGFGKLGTGDGPASATSHPSISRDAGASNAKLVWSHGQDGGAHNAHQHWEKHESEFPEYHSAKEYEAGALAFVRTPPAGTLTKHRSNGDTLYYDPSTNTFAVADENGEPRTMFRPDSGQSYWDRQ